MPAYAVWILLTLAGAAFSLFVAAIINAKLWAASVKDNHLTHIQDAVEKTAEHTASTSLALAELAIREQMRHEQDKQQFEQLKELIMTRGL